ncbi:MAG: hypothetical protein KDD45_01415 [Bdellovibrionales bacterium]|nr:hypothetical protein [Bdellovibrionales bacterium]
MYLKLFIIFILLNQAYAAETKEIETYFTADQFSNCLSEEMSKNFSLDEFEKRVRNIHSLRMELAATDADVQGLDCNFYCRNEGLSGVSLLRPLGCWLDKMLVARLMLHSGPLVLTNIKFKKLIKPKMSLHQIRDAIVMATKAPISDWLSGQPDNSVSHWELFKIANHIYGDPFVALGVIGELFENERERCDRKSKTKNKCTFANKMKPLIRPSDSDPVGRNYHFWAHLNMIWQSGGLMEKSASYYFEIWKDKDYGDHTANILGIETSAQAYTKTKFKLASFGKHFANHKCDL